GAGHELEDLRQQGAHVHVGRITAGKRQLVDVLKGVEACIARVQPGDAHRAALRRRTRAGAVVTLAAEKLLFRNVSWERPVVTLSGKKLCDINKRLEMF